MEELKFSTYDNEDLIFHYSVLDSKMMTEVLELINYIDNVEVVYRPYLLDLRERLVSLMGDKYVELINQMVDTGEPIDNVVSAVYNLDEYLYQELSLIDYSLELCETRCSDDTETSTYTLDTRYDNIVKSIRSKFVNICEMNTFLKDLIHYYRYGDGSSTVIGEI